MIRSGLIIGIGDVLHGDLGFGCFALETLSREASGTPVQLFYLGDDPRCAGGLIYDADLLIIVGALHLGVSSGRLHAWSYRVFKEHLGWLAAEYEVIRFLVEALARAELAGGFPGEFLFIWIEPQLVNGYGLSSQAQKALRKATMFIKQKLFERSLLPEETLRITTMSRPERLDAVT
jgi:hydrogenase maturation protease